MDYLYFQVEAALDVLQPTFGYLLGFIACGGITGILASRVWDSSRWTDLLLPNIVGMLFLFIPGVLYLYVVMRFFIGQPFLPGQVLISGMLLFLPSEFGKIFLAAWLSHKIKVRIRNV